MAIAEKIPKQKIDSKKMDAFLSKGGSHPLQEDTSSQDTDYRMTLRIPRNLLNSRV